MQQVTSIPKLAIRKPDSHKGDFGKVCIIGGSFGMSGAAALMGMAALKSGAGLVRLGVAKSILPVVATIDPCYTTFPLAEDKDGRISARALNTILNVIGDNDRPHDTCNPNHSSGHGIEVNSTVALEEEKRAWIYGNIIECNRGTPGNGITISTNGVVTGKDEYGKSSPEYQNEIRNHIGFGINLGNFDGNDISNNHLIGNTGGIQATNFNNNTFANNIIE